MTGCQRGKLIALCGVDGAGKTTQLLRLSRHLQQRGAVYLTKQPTDWFRQDPVVRAYLNLELPVTELLLSELALFSSADRLRHLRNELEPRLAAGEIVLTDRHILSAYASFLAGGFTDLEWLMSLNRLMPLPDLAIYLDVEPAVACARIMARDGSSRKCQELDQAFLARMRAAFLEQPWGATYLPHYCVIDGSAPPDTVETRIRTVVDGLFADPPRPLIEPVRAP
jgi:dTMP kinase